jgi:hypothetical protein
LSQEYINEIITNLKLIGKIKKNCKIRVNGKIIIESISVWNSFIRFYYHEDRMKTYNFIKETIDKVIIILELKKDFLIENEFCKNTIKNLIESINGLENMKYTYSEDDNYTSCIQTLIESIQRMLIFYKKNYPILFESLDKTID